MSTVEPLLFVVILMLIVSGCMSDAERDLYQEITVSLEITSVTPTEECWDIITIRYPNGQHSRLHVPRNLYQPGDTYPRTMRKWQAIELGIERDSWQAQSND